MLKTLRALKKYYQPYQYLVIIGSLGTIIFALLAQVDPYVTGLIIDNVLTSQDTDFVIKGALIILGVTIVRGGFRYAYLMSFEKLSQNTVYDLREDLYKKLQSLDISYYDSVPNGKIMSKMTSDVEAVRHFFSWNTQVGLLQGCFFVFGIIAMFLINVTLTSTLLLIVPFIAFFSLRLSRTVKPIFSKIREQFSRLNTVVSENISGNRVVKAFARESFEVEKFEKENEGYMNSNLEAAAIWEKNLPALDAFAILFNVIVLVVGSMLIFKEQMTIGELVAFNRLLWMINNPLRMFGWIINSTQNFIASYERIDELLNEESNLKLPKSEVEGEKLEGHIIFDHVSFDYKDGPILKDISFDVVPGQTVAILGATGSGKSTLISLMQRFYDPTEGSIFIDNNAIEDIELQVLRNNISVAMQDIFLFSDTIESNISYGVPNASKKKIRYAAEIAGVNEFIYQLDENFGTIVGERGVGLSGGQKQRIALARAIIEDPSILILDDTTSAVDMETEYKILSELKKVNANRTTFIIAHRISSVKDADIILVMDEGSIIERGKHNELLSNKGYYYDVFTQQMGEFDPRIKEGA